MSILGNKLEWCVEFNGRLVGQTRLSVNASFKRYFCKYDFIMLMGELLQEGVIHFLIKLKWQFSLIRISFIIWKFNSSK